MYDTGVQGSHLYGHVLSVYFLLFNRVEIVVRQPLMTRESRPAHGLTVPTGRGVASVEHSFESSVLVPSRSQAARVPHRRLVHTSSSPSLHTHFEGTTPSKFHSHHAST